MSLIDPVEVADAAGLRHVDPSRLPIVRRRCGRGFTFIGRTGRRVDGSVRGRIEALAIPPAWEDVRIAADATAHVQAVGVDEAGRTQYRYHPDFRAAADELKFVRLREVGRRIGRVRDATGAALRLDDRSDGDVPLVVAVIDTTLLRVGSERYVRENESFGASTLRARHATVGRDGVRLRFTAKGGVERDLLVDDERLAVAIAARKRRAESPETPLFRGPEGGEITGELVAGRLERWAGIPMSAKELRTWGATATMVEALCGSGAAAERDPHDAVLCAYDVVAERLGNTREIARSSYVAPSVVEAWDGGALIDLWGSSRSSAKHSRAEQVVRKLLG